MSPASSSKDADAEPKDQTPETSRPSRGSDDEMADQSNPENQDGGENAFTEVDVKEQDRWLPIANVARIMKSALPENAKIAKEAKECMQECVSEFISFITSEASEKCHQEKRKTVNGEDILFAMTSLGFENYAEALKIYLAKFREQAQRANEGNNRPTSSYGGAGPSASGGADTGDSNLMAAQLGSISHEGQSYGMFPDGGHNGTGPEY